MEDKERCLQAAPALTPAASSSPSNQVQTPKHLPPAIPEKRLFVSMADLGCRGPSLSQRLLQPVVEPGSSHGFALLRERAAAKTGLTAAPGGKPDPRVGQALGDASAWLEKPTFRSSKFNLCTRRIHKI